jgi:hypothetical protein
MSPVLENGSLNGIGKFVSYWLPIIILTGSIIWSNATLTEQVKVLKLANENVSHRLDTDILTREEFKAHWDSQLQANDQVHYDLQNITNLLISIGLRQSPLSLRTTIDLKKK